MHEGLDALLEEFWNPLLVKLPHEFIGEVLKRELVECHKFHVLEIHAFLCCSKERRARYVRMARMSTSARYCLGMAKLGVLCSVKEIMR